METLPADLVLHIAGMCPDALTLHELRRTNSALRKIVQGMTPATDGKGVQGLAPRIVDLSGKVEHWTRIIERCGGNDAFARAFTVGECPVVRFNVRDTDAKQRAFLARFPTAPYHKVTIELDSYSLVPNYNMEHLSIYNKNLSFYHTPPVKVLTLTYCAMLPAFALAVCRNGTTAIHVKQCRMFINNRYIPVDDFSLTRHGKEWHARIAARALNGRLDLRPFLSMCTTVHICGDVARWTTFACPPGVHTVTVTNCNILVCGDTRDLRRIEATNSAVSLPDDWSASDTSGDTFHAHCTFTRVK